MSKRDDCDMWREVRNELVGTVISRMQNARSEKRNRKVYDPEIESPKAVYEVEEMLNNPYMNREEVPLAMDIFKPVVPDDRDLPAIVVIHGGALIFGDRGISRSYAKALAKRGYLVFSIEYRHAPRANACEQLDDVCAGMDLVGRKMLEFNVDLTRIFLTAESAGAYLATYVAAMKKSKKLQDAIGYKPTRMTFRALGLHGGMFYTDKDDPIGWFLADQFYGNKLMDDNFRQYLDPEHEEIINNLPPVFLTTSRGDFLNNYTLMYHEALKKAGRKSRLVYFGDETLGHAFVGLDANRAESVKAMDLMTDYFEEQALQAKIDEKRIIEETRVLMKINESIKSGDIVEQKIWCFIKELNSYSQDQLDSIAMADGDGDYTYRQIFTRWDQYARVFSGLGITGENASRVGMTGTPSVETASAFYALNMTGTSVSMINTVDVLDDDRLKPMIEQEGITDLILTDVAADGRLVRHLAREKDRLGIRHIIILHIPTRGKYVSEADRRNARIRKRDYKSIKGIYLMDEIIDDYEETPIAYATDDFDAAALIIHTSGTTRGIHKPIPMSDRALNEAVSRLLRDNTFKSLRGRAVVCQNMDYSGSYSMIDMLHLPLAFGGKIVTLPYVGQGPLLGKAIASERANVVFGSAPLFDMWSRLSIKLDLSALELVFLGGSYVSPESKRNCDDFLKKNGANVKSVIGYGLSEVGAACILSTPDRDDDAIGYPLPGVRVKIRDEKTKEFHDISDGPRTGVLYVGTASVSGGSIGDEVFFEHEMIDGESYINTYDLVTVGVDGALTYIGRMDSYYVNNDGVSFDADLIETAISRQPSIKACAIAPTYDKLLHDTIPVLYVVTTKHGNQEKMIVKRALGNTFIDEDLINKTNLPGQCIITEWIPYNKNGKVDVHMIMSKQVKGKSYRIEPTHKEGELVRIDLIPIQDSPGQIAGIPKELEKDVEPMVKRMQERRGTTAGEGSIY